MSDTKYERTSAALDQLQTGVNAIVADSVVTSFNAGYEGGYKQAKKECRALLQELYYALSDALELADDYSDVEGDSEHIRPNRAMSMAQEWEPLVERAGKVLKEEDK